MYLSLLNENISNVKEKYFNKPFFVFLSLTNICNANCVFCDVRSNKNLLCSIDVYKLIDELSLMGTKYIHFTGGGEPFTDKNIINYMEYASNKDINIIFITNGYLLNQYVDKFININIKAVFVSLDSCYPEIHNNLRRTNNLFEHAIEGINKLKKIKPEVKININHVLNSKNIDSFDNFIALKEKVNFDFLNPIVIKDCENLTPTKEQISNFNAKEQKFESLLNKYNVKLLCNTLDIFKEEININGERKQNENLRCFFANFSAFIDCPTGKVYPCDCSIHCDRNLYCLGSLHNLSFKDIWEGKIRLNLIEKLNHGDMSCKTKCDEANCIFNRTFLKGV